MDVLDLCPLVRGMAPARLAIYCVLVFVLGTVVSRAWRRFRETR